MKKILILIIMFAYDRFKTDYNKIALRGPENLSN
jgi:hypothetical protein